MSRFGTRGSLAIPVVFQLPEEAIPTMTQNHQRTFDQLCARRRARRRCLSTTAEVLAWDEQTMMPSAGAEYRAEQLTLLAGIVHQRSVDPRVGQWLAELAESPLAAEPHSDTGTTIRQLKREYDKQVKLPQSLVEELARTASLAQHAWEKARTDDDFAQFRPHLAKTYELKRAQAAALGYEHTPYDALLDEYEPHEKTATVAGVLAELRAALVPLVAEIAASKRKPDVDILARRYPVDAQDEFSRVASAAIGFDYGRGRLDVTAHPFCTGLGPNDCRITTRYDERLFNSAFFGTLHEAGHGIYDQGSAQRVVWVAAGRSRLAGHSRIAIAHVGKSGGPQPAVLGAFLSAGEETVSRSARRRFARCVLLSPSTTCGRRWCASRRTKPRTTCTS